MDYAKITQLQVEHFGNAKITQKLRNLRKKCANCAASAKNLRRLRRPHRLLRLRVGPR